jgi:phage terminase small subunit
MTKKEKDFCLAYVKLLNISKAAKEAGYSPVFILKKCHLLMRRPHIIDEIKRLQSRLDNFAEKSATDVVNELSKIGFSQPSDYLKPDPLNGDKWIGKSPNELTAPQRVAIARINCRDVKIGKDEDGNDMFRQEYSYHLHDKLNALIQMGRHYGLFDDKLKISGPVHNMFANISSQKLAQLQKSFATVMAKPDPITIEGKIVNGK